MVKQIFGIKLAPVIVAFATVATIGTAFTASAAHGSVDNHRHEHGYGGYDEDQCKNGGWRIFKNPNGTQKFKNQGQCIAFFESKEHNHDHDKDHDHDRDHDHGH